MINQSVINMIHSVTLAVLAILLLVITWMVGDHGIGQAVHTQRLIRHETDLYRLEIKLNLLLLRTEKDEKLMLETARCLEIISQKMGNQQKIDRVPFAPQNRQVH